MNRTYIKQSTLQKNDARNKVAKIISYLRSNRGPQSVHKIRIRTRIDIQDSKNSNVFLSLKQNKKVLVSGTTFEYKPSISGISNRDDLRQWLQKHPIGTKYDDLRDAYVKAETHLAEWQKTGRIITFMNAEKKQNIIFWYCGRLRKNKIIFNDKNDKNNDKNQDKNDNKNDKSADKNGDALIGNIEEIDDKQCDKTMFPLIGDSIVSTWNDIEIPIIKTSLENKLRECNLLNDNFSRKRTRKNANLNNGFRKTKHRRRNLNSMNITNIHMLEDEATKQKFIKNADNRKDKGRELPSLPPT